MANKEFNYNKYKVLLKETVNYKEEQNSEADNALVRQQLWMLEQELKDKKADLEEKIAEQIAEATALAQQEQEVVAEAEDIKAKLEELPELREEVNKVNDYYKNLNEWFLWKWAWKYSKDFLIYAIVLMFVCCLTRSWLCVIAWTIWALGRNNVVKNFEKVEKGAFWEDYHG